MPTHDKSTEELLNEIKSTNEIQKFIDSNSGEFTSEPLHKLLCEMIKNKGLKKSDVVKRSGLNRVYAYQILQGRRLPSRDKLIALCFGLRITLDETNDVLKSAGFAKLYARSKRDSLIIFAINSKKSIFVVNELLFDNGFEILTA